MIELIIKTDQLNVDLEDIESTCHEGTCVHWMQIVLADMQINEETSECWEDLFF